MEYNIFDSIPSNTVCGEDNEFANFLQKSALYNSMEVDRKNILDLILLLDGKVRISAYCEKCNRERVFTMKPYIYSTDNTNMCYSRKLSEEVLNFQNQYIINSSASDAAVSKEKTIWKWRSQQVEAVSRILSFEFICSMNDEHHLDYIVRADGNRFQKIGQYPLIANLTFHELYVYERVMLRDDFNEFRKAITLYENGYGAGSYACLCRILERLINQVKEKAGDVIDTETFDKAHVGEKITMLSSYLPSTLTENMALHNILSKGVYELTEKECCIYFPVLRSCICMILDQWEEMRKREEKEKEISAALSKIATNLK